MKYREATLKKLLESPKITVLIVGAGINGCGLFRELALQGIDSLLIDKSDFMSGASSAPSRMIHGGLRYLENREGRLVRESLAERNLLMKNAPHYVKPLPTIIPIYTWFSGIVNGIRRFVGLKATSTPRGAVIVKLGLMLYDVFTRKTRIMPTHSFFSRKASLKTRPLLDPKIVCTALFYDAWISFPERLGIELIREGINLQERAGALNYVSLKGVENGQVILNDVLTHELIYIQPKIVVNATGAWVDLTNFSMGYKTKFIGGTKGSHLIVDNKNLMDAANGQMVYYENNEGRICILFPLHGKVMIGSTDIKISNPDDAVCTEDEVEYLMDSVRQIFPELEINPSQIVFRYSGVRPLPSIEGNLKNSQISRDHSIKIQDPSPKHPFPVLNLIGGKWTTFRAFGEETADKVLSYLNHTKKIDSRDIPIGGGIDFPKTENERVQWEEHVSMISGLNRSRIQQLLFKYGTSAKNVIDFMLQEEDALLMHHHAYSKREIKYLIEREFVEHLDDLVLRRTVLALSGDLTKDLLLELADIQKDALGLSQEQKEIEIKRTQQLLEKKFGMKFN